MQIDNLLEELQKTSNDNTDLLKKIESLELEKSKLEQQITKYIDRKNDLLKKIEQQNHEIDGMLEGTSELSNTSELTHQEQLNEIINGLEKQLDEYKNGNNTNNEELIEEIENRLKLYRNITLFDKMEKVEYDKLKKIVDELEDQLKECKDAIANEQVPDADGEQLEKLACTVDEAERRVKQFEETLNEYNNIATTSNLKEENAQLNEYLTKLQAEYDTLRKSTREGNIGSYEKRIKELENLKTKQEKECEELLSSLKQQYEDIMEKL